MIFKNLRNLSMQIRGYFQLQTFIKINLQSKQQNKNPQEQILPKIKTLSAFWEATELASVEMRLFP